MENLNAEQIKKALECCLTTSEGDCIACGYRGKKDGLFITCTNCLMADALALINSQEQRIKELIEENERLKLDVEVCGAELSRYTENIVQMAKQDRAYTVRKMQERLKDALNDMARYDFHGNNNEYFIIGKSFIDQIAKEMLEQEEIDNE